MTHHGHIHMLYTNGGFVVKTVLFINIQGKALWHGIHFFRVRRLRETEGKKRRFQFKNLIRLDVLHAQVSQ